MTSDVQSIPSAQRFPAEQRHADDIAALRAWDRHPCPAGWQLSPRAVRSFILGSDGEALGGRVIERKIFGNDVLVERSIVTLAGQRGLLLAGEPGTAKSLLSELLAAAISGRSTLTVQGSAGTVEEGIRYSWNYALLLRDGPTPAALVAGPLHQAMEQGALMRFEEITRCPVEIQDLLIPVLSDRVLHVPELKGEGSLVLSRPGFNIIATANLKDRGVNEMSSALKRRLNFETMQPLTDPRLEGELVSREVQRLLTAEGIGASVAPELTGLLVTLFQELRQAQALGVALEPMSNVLSTAEAINVLHSALADCWYLGDGSAGPAQLLRHLGGTLIKGEEDDRRRLRDYLRLVRGHRADEPAWRALLEGEVWL
ncbi:ATP-binding protein [Thiocystis violacea]|uniref:ATP-binding protein n=1 Tax=Thiocystis violacea TaxID=13725 RepID=UPI0019045BDE|nr:AAA family ATPase [Thiocystis violacea]MBK1721273.1 AAA family ATPase [Thiocystis violacea]